MKRSFALLVLTLLVACTGPQAPQIKPGPHIPQIEIVPPTISEFPEKPKYEPPPTAPNETGNVITVKMDAKMFAFLPNEIRAKKGDLVRLTITSIDVPHTFTLPAYGIDQKLPVGQDVVIEFIADKVGTFSFSCMMPGHADKGMKGTLIVT